MKIYFNGWFGSFDKTNPGLNNFFLNLFEDIQRKMLC